MKPYNKFTYELEQLINRHSMENGSNTPDFILAQYLVSCLRAFNVAIERRTQLAELNEGVAKINAELDQLEE